MCFGQGNIRNEWTYLATTTTSINDSRTILLRRPVTFSNREACKKLKMSRVGKRNITTDAYLESGHTEHRKDVVG